jgi:hypothetical protein
MLSTTAVLECLWAAFYATGQDIYVRRVLHIAQHWADFTNLPDHTEYCVSLEKKLPADIMVRTYMWPELVFLLVILWHCIAEEQHG